MIDLSARIIQTPPVMPAKPPVRLHPLRRIAQVLCGVGLVLLPLTNGLRLDVRRDEFYFLWHRMAAHDLVLLSWAAMLGAWLLVTVSFLYGRVWCGTVCPQTLLSDFAVSVQTRLDKACRRLFVRMIRSGQLPPSPALPPKTGEGRQRPVSNITFPPPLVLGGGPSHASVWSGEQGQRVGASSPGQGAGGPLILSRTLWVAVLLAVSVGTGYVLACYWLAPHTVAAALRRPLSDPAAALTVYAIAAVVLADMALVRRRFCSHFCPYGALMSTLSDANTLSARFLTERQDECITCHKCETDCPMGIDIKQGVGQLSCIGCGECVDACNDVLGRRGIPGLIEFRYGTEADRQIQSLTLAQKLGLWDSRRVGVAVTLVAFLLITLWEAFGMRPLHATLAANGALGRTAGGAAFNSYTLTLTGGGPHGADCRLSVNGLAGASVTPSAVHLEARDTVNVPVTVFVPVAHPGRQPMTLMVRAQGDATRAPAIFYAP